MVAQEVICDNCSTLYLKNMQLFRSAESWSGCKKLPKFLKLAMAIQCIHFGWDTEVSEWFVVTSLSLPEISSLFGNSWSTGTFLDINK